MPALPDLQKNFVAGLLHDDTATLVEIKTTGALTSAQRMHIYRNNVFYILTANLKEIFSATVALGGAGFFQYLGREFIRAHPPATGDMGVYGEKLPDFMRQSGLIKNHPFLADVAALEWLRHESYRSAGAGTEPLHPSIRIFSSQWPVFSLWKLGKGQLRTEDVNIQSGGENVLLFRQGNGIEMWLVDSDELALVKALSQGEDCPKSAFLSRLENAGLTQHKKDKT